MRMGLQHSHESFVVYLRALVQDGLAHMCGVTWRAVYLKFYFLICKRRKLWHLRCQQGMDMMWERRLGGQKRLCLNMLTGCNMFEWVTGKRGIHSHTRFPCLKISRRFGFAICFVPCSGWVFGSVASALPQAATSLQGTGRRSIRHIRRRWWWQRRGGIVALMSTHRVAPSVPETPGSQDLLCPPKMSVLAPDFRLLPFHPLMNQYGWIRMRTVLYWSIDVYDLWCHLAHRDLGFLPDLGSATRTQQVSISLPKYHLCWVKDGGADSFLACKEEARSAPPAAALEAHSLLRVISCPRQISCKWLLPHIAMCFFFSCSIPPPPLPPPPPPPQHHLTITTFFTTPPTQHHQHSTINRSSSTQHQQHNTINTHHLHNGALGAPPARFAWQAQHLEHLHRGPAEVRRQLRTLGAASFCVAGAALGAP